MHSKSISSLVSSILLLAFVLTTSAITFKFFTSFTRKSQEETSSFLTSQLSCTYGNLKIVDFKCSEDPNLVLFLHFDEGYGTAVYDTSGHGNDGTIYNGSVVCANPPTPNAGCPEWVNSIENLGKALSFDGVDDYVEVPDSPSLRLPNEFSVELWVKSSYVAGDNPIVIRKGIGNPRYVNYAILQDGNGLFKAWVGKYDSTATKSVSFGSLTDGKWHHLVMTFTTSYLITYTDGEQVGKSATGWSAYTSADNVLLGYQWGQWFNGTIDEVRIYNRALSEEEIKEIYQKGIHLTLVVANKGRVNLGKDFVVLAKIGGKTLIRNVTLANDLTPGKFEKIELVNLTQVGKLSYLRISSMTCPGVYDEIKSIEGKYC